MTASQTLLKWTDQKFDVSPFLKAPADPFHATAHGAIFAADCMKVLPLLKDEVVDTVFADPPFNLGKEYGKNTDDSLPDERYVRWCQEWLAECVRVLKPGGSLFLYNLPKWNILLGAFLHTQGLELRHWIAIEMSACLPIPAVCIRATTACSTTARARQKLSIASARQSLRVGIVVRGEGLRWPPRRDEPERRHVKGRLDRYPPVRHWKFKSKNRRSNALSTKILDRVIDMSTDPGDLVIDPFGGSGTTFVVCESKHRHWIGSEIDFAEDIVHRLKGDGIRPHKNGDFIER